MKALAILLLTCASLLSAETNLFPNRAGLEINSDFAEFRLKEGIFYYSNNVVVTDPPAKPGGPPTVVRCREATATRGADGKFESIVAEHSVEIRQGEDIARSARAVYARSNEWLVLTGPFNPGDTNFPRPYLIRGRDTIEANQIIYNRMTDKVTFFEKQRTIISSQTLSRGNTNSAGTNRSGAKPQFPFSTR
jgi:lipopolysaccharide export system protein LptA